MTEREYMEFIEKTRKQIQSGDTEAAGKNLEYAFQIKPVRLRWFLAKAEWMFRCGHPGKEIIEFLQGKYEVSLECPETVDILRLLIKIYHSQEELLEEKRIKYCLWEYQSAKNERKKKPVPYRDFERGFQKHRENFLNCPNDIPLLQLLMEDYYIRGEAVVAFILSYILGQLDSEYEAPTGFVSWLTNSEYLRERLQEDEKCVYILMADNEQDIADYEVLSNALLVLDKKVYFLDKPLPVQTDCEINLSDTCSISLENREDYGNLQIYHPVAVRCDGNSPKDNRGYLIRHILKCEPEGLAILFCTSSLMDELSIREMLQKNMGRLSDRSVLENDKIAFGWCGSYTAYASRIYGFDVEERINRPAECQFSIVVPARGAVDTLRYTLKTCLNQRYDMDYEVVLSDNSVNGDTAVHDLYLELENPRLHYYKTPRDLSLTKSFEYAFLQAKGEFIFSIGADDGVLPWALGALSVLLEQYPEEDILQWERGFYAWPGFNGGQQHQFVIPGKYHKGDLKSSYISREEYISVVMDNPNMMYVLPLLYINSGFRRRYMKRLLDENGELWDGPCQDIYMGIVNILLNKKVLFTKYPLTIAGMSNSSIGAGSVAGFNEKQIKEHQKALNGSGIVKYVRCDLEMDVPDAGNDTVVLYRAIHRMLNRGIKLNNTTFDYKKMFRLIFQKMDVVDLGYDYKMLQFKLAVHHHGEIFKVWCDKEIYRPAMLPRTINMEALEKAKENKCYEEGISENGAETLDASKNGVSNIWEAVLFFEERTGL